MQKHLAATGLSAAGATFARYLWSAPLVAILLWALFSHSGTAYPPIGVWFLGFVTAGGICQILATVCLVVLFKQRNFAVGISFKKTETLQAAVFGAVLLGDALPLMGWGIIVLGFCGVLLLSSAPSNALVSWRDLLQRSTVLGLAAGFFFGASGVFYRGAALELADLGAVHRGMFSLAFAIWIQLLLLGLYLVMMQRGEVIRVIRHWKITALVGLTSMVGSGCLFVAFSLQNVAYVNAVGQIEMVFAALSSRFVFKEHTTQREALGMTLIVLSVVLLIMFG
ncbi:membrane protein [Amylibacter marinus]|uniref:Membrane protein n=2 Tax=Amylibacter marinus TaxID=1475483 RepID=A0ABQ5VU23_9RHOB|nr:membrane protein [Amylibacter marinus]